MLRNLADNPLKISDVAKCFNVNRSTVLRWIEKGHLHSTKFPSGTHRLLKEDILEFLAKSEKAGLEAKAKRILVVDDETPIRKLLGIMLQQMNFAMEIREKDNGLDALLEIGAFRPDIIVLDYHLEDIEGTRVISKIRAHEAFMNIPVILISGVHAVEPGDLIGETTFLKKPFRFEDLHREIQTHLFQEKRNA